MFFSVFFQIQQVLGHLLESKLQYHEPERFWKVFKLWGQTVNIREQQDAFDFFQALIDQIDEHLKVHWFTRYFMSYWKICKLICSAVKGIMSVIHVLIQLCMYSNFVHLQRNGKLEIFKRKFQGIFSDQKICKDCPHRFVFL